AAARAGPAAAGAAVGTAGPGAAADPYARRDADAGRHPEAKRGAEVAAGPGGAAGPEAAAGAGGAAGRGGAPGPGGAAGQDEVLRRVSAAVLAVTRELSVGDVLQVIVRSVRSLSGARYVALGVPDDRGSFAEFVVDGISERWRKAIGPLPRQHGMLAVVLREGQPLRLADIRADPRFEGGWPPAHPGLGDLLRGAEKGGGRGVRLLLGAQEGAGGGFPRAGGGGLGVFRRARRDRVDHRPPLRAGPPAFRAGRTRPAGQG